MKRYKLRIPVPAGKLETVIDDPETGRRGLLLVAHPHPLHGGTLDNKVVTTLAKAANEAGWVSVRPNFRGVGMSDGEFDAGVGETEDLLAVARFVEASYPGLPRALAGFSFGAFVQHRLRQELHATRLILVQFFLDSDIVPFNLLGEGLLTADVDGKAKPKNEAWNSDYGHAG